MGRIFHFLRNDFRGGEPVRHFCRNFWHNRVANILMDLTGIGCRIEKPVDSDGRGWKIIVDGTSDETPPDGYTFPSGPPYHFQVIQYGTAQVQVRGGVRIVSNVFSGTYDQLPIALAGTAGAVSDLVTLSNAGNGVNYVLATLTWDGYTNVLTAACSLTPPDYTDDNVTQLAHFTVAGGLITANTLVQDWNGGNLPMLWNGPDGLSLEINAQPTGGAIRSMSLLDYYTASPTEPGANAAFPYRPDTGMGGPSALQYADHDGFVDWLNDAFSEIGHLHIWDDLTDVEDLDDGTGLDIPRLKLDKSGVEWVHPTDILSGMGGADLEGWFVDGLFTNVASVNAITIIAQTAIGGPYHSIIVLGIDNGVA